MHGFKKVNTIWTGELNQRNVIVLHQNERGIGKSIPVDREGLTVLKSTLPCWGWENDISLSPPSPLRPPPLAPFLPLLISWPLCPFLFRSASCVIVSIFKLAIKKRWQELDAITIYCRLIIWKISGLEQTSWPECHGAACALCHPPHPPLQMQEIVDQPHHQCKTATFWNTLVIKRNCGSTLLQSCVLDVMSCMILQLRKSAKHTFWTHCSFGFEL